MRTPYPQYYRPQPVPAIARPSWVRWLKLAIFSVLALFILSLPFLIVGGVYFYYLATDQIFPGVTVGTVSYSNLTRDEMVKALDTDWNGKTRLSLTDGSQRWPVTPIEVGLWVNPQATADRAYQFGRGDDGLKEYLWLLRFGKWQVEPALVFDENVARAGLERASAQINVPAQNATLRLENGNWVVVPAQNGVSVDVEKTVVNVASSPQTVIKNGFLTLSMQAIAPRVTDLTPVLDNLRAALDNPLKIRAYDPINDETIEWVVPRETFAGWIVMQQQGDELSFDLDGQQLVAYLEQWKTSLGAERTLEPFTPPVNLASYWRSGEPVTVLLHRNPTTYTVEAGDTLTRIAFKVGMPYWKIQQANPGINPNSLSAGQTLTIPSSNEMLPLPIVMGKRIVVSISQQRMWTYENGQQRSEHVISTGIDRSPTIPGIYQVRTHELSAYASVWDLTMPHFIGIYEGWPGFMNGFHGLPTLSNGRILWEGTLGQQVSYGCIILSLGEAEDLYQWAEEGVVVEIQP